MVLYRIALALLLVLSARDFVQSAALAFLAKGDDLAVHVEGITAEVSLSTDYLLRITATLDGATPRTLPEAMTMRQTQRDLQRSDRRPPPGSGWKAPGKPESVSRWRTQRTPGTPGPTLPAGAARCSFADRNSCGDSMRRACTRRPRSSRAMGLRGLASPGPRQSHRRSWISF